MKWTACFVLLMGWSLFTRAQNTIGIPTIVNYSREIYNAASQNWGIAQGANGIMYFANNDGLLCFDGAFWRLYSLPNKTKARSLAIAPNGRIYVGSQGEIGFFAPNKRGALVYQSLNNLIPKPIPEFTDVWNVVLAGEKVFFRSNKIVMEYNGRSISIHHNEHWSYLGSVQHKLIAQKHGGSLVQWKNGSWLPLMEPGGIPAGDMVRGILPFGHDSLLVATMRHGMYMLHDGKLSPFETPDLQQVAAKYMYGLTSLQSNRIAVTTILGGCYIIDKHGKFVQLFSKQEGIQNNNVLSVFVDRDENIWLGLDNGIDLVTYNNAVKRIFPESEDRNSGYTSLVHNNQLYLGLSSGLYSVPLTGQTDLSYTLGSFSYMKQTQGRVWNLSVLQDLLMLCHTNGAYIIKDGKALPYDLSKGFWNFRKIESHTTDNLVVAGTYNGLHLYSLENGKLLDKAVSAVFESARFVIVHNGVIWVAHPYIGLFKVIYQNGKLLHQLYPDSARILTSNNNKIFQIRGKLILSNDNGVFELNESVGDFVHAQWLERYFNGKPVSFLTEAPGGNIWFCMERKVGVIDPEVKKDKAVFIPELDNKIMAGGFDHINAIDSNNIIIAGEQGFYHINYAAYKHSKHRLQLLLHGVTLPLMNNQLLYGGFLGKPNYQPQVAFKYNAIHFECASTLYGQFDNTEYSYFLEGFDKQWSAWGKKTERDYTNLPAGNYVFKAKCRNNFDNESAITSFSFVVLPPWYQTWWAYGLFAILFFIVLYGFYKRQQRKYKRREKLKLQEQQRVYDEEKKRRQMLHEIEIGKSEKEIIELRNEKLQAEIRHKNTELASSAMNLVRKLEIFSKIKHDLNEYRNHAEAKNGTKDLQKIIKLIDSEMDEDDQWEHFAIHFDSVHTDYLKKLKEFCPTLTATELKLAAYLRLNLTTKEIAQLLNISVRGVETSRYRLRKKLGLVSNEASLFDFLIQVTGT